MRNLKRLMLDTNVFNDLLDGKLSLEVFAGRELCATHVQIDEISNTSNEKRRMELTSLFVSIVDKKMPTATAVYDDSQSDEAKWGDGVEYEEILQKLEKLDRISGKKIRYPNQSRDARIAETAIKNGLILVTRDGNLGKVVQEYGGELLRL